MSQPKKWIEISTHPSEIRYQALSDQLKSQGIDNEVEFFQFSNEDEWQAVLDEKENHIDGIRLGRGLGEAILDRYPNHSVHINRLGSADCLVKANGSWWPRSASYEGLLRVFSGVGETLDLSSSALIVGAGAMARASMAVLFREGFKRFGLTALDEDRGRLLIEKLRRVYLGAELEFVPKDELILLPGKYGIIVNTTPSSKDNELLVELSYFNFFIPNGVAVDLYLQPVVTDFLHEAREIGASIVSGVEVAAATDATWAEWALGVELDQKTYLETLKSRFA